MGLRYLFGQLVSGLDLRSLTLEEFSDLELDMCTCPAHPPA